MRKTAAIDTKALNNFKESLKGKEALKSVTSPELMYDAAGAGLGGLGTYLLAGALGQQKERRLLWTLLGAATGGVGTHVGLGMLPGSPGFNGTLRDQIRLDLAARNADKDTQQAVAKAGDVATAAGEATQKAEDTKNSHIGRITGTAAGAGTGIVLTAKDKFIGPAPLVNKYNSLIADTGLTDVTTKGINDLVDSSRKALHKAYIASPSITFPPPRTDAAMISAGKAVPALKAQAEQLEKALKLQEDVLPIIDRSVSGSWNPFHRVKAEPDGNGFKLKQTTASKLARGGAQTLALAGLGHLLGWGADYWRARKGADIANNAQLDAQAIADTLKNAK